MTVFDSIGLPIESEAPTIRIKLDRDNHRFYEKNFDYGDDTGMADLSMVWGLVLSGIVYKLIDRRVPISAREKRWLMYIVVGFAIWAFAGDMLSNPLDMHEIVFWVMSGEYLDTPLEPPIPTYLLQRLLHWSIGIVIVILCRWDYRRTFPPTPPPIPA